MFSPVLIIPIHIIWKIKVHTRQKIGLATSLCLTIVIIVMTVIRAAGFMTPENQLDQLWDGYWNIIAAEVGLTMASATAFRALYVSKSGHTHRKESSGGRTWVAHWWYKARSKRRTHEEEGEEGKELSAGSGWTYSNNRMSTEAPQVPRHVLPRGHRGQNTMVSGQGLYESRFRMSNIINDPWDDAPVNVDEDLQTRRHQIEVAGAVSHHQ